MTMAATEIEEKVTELQERVVQLERAVRLLPRKPSFPIPKPKQPVSAREAVAVLKQMGVVRDPLPEEEALAEEWRRLPEEEKQAHIEYMRSLVLDPPLSQIIIENRR